MAEVPERGARALRTFLYALMGVFAVLVEIAPLGASALAIPSPDLLLCATFFWVVRRPGSAPFWLIFMLGLTRDLVSGGPIGPGALGLLMVTEILRPRGAMILRLPLLVEWLALGAAAAGCAAFQMLMLTIVLAPTPGLTPLAMQVGLTVACYPITLILFRKVLRINARKTAGKPLPAAFMFGDGR